MKTETPKNKWKAWHLIVIGAVIFIGWGIQSTCNNFDQMAESARLTDPKEVRKDKINKQINKWDGTCIPVLNAVKENMHDPKSFELVDNKVIDNGTDTLQVEMKYRGKNAFNATVTEAVYAEVDINGLLIKIEKQED